MLVEIRSNAMHSLNGAFPFPYVPVRVTRIALVAPLSGRTGSALVRHSEGRTFAAHSVKQVL